MDKILLIKRLNKIAQMLDTMNMPEEADGVTDVMENLTDSPQVNAWANYGRSLAKKDIDFMPPVKPRASMITYTDVTEKAITKAYIYGRKSIKNIGAKCR